MHHFFVTVGQRLRPHALAGAVETGEYVILWTRVFIVHLVKIIAAFVGLDPDIIRVVSFMEKWVWIATFAAFFCRIFLRLWRIRGLDL
jgi:hypothetical protein